MLGFLVAWGVLDAIVNVRYPGKETRLWYLLPSLDIVVLLGTFALVAALRRRVPVWVHGALAAVLLVLRLLRVADGISTRFLRRPYSLYLNLSLLPELPRLMRETVPPLTLILGVLGVLGVLSLVVALTLWALRTLERAMASPTNVKIWAVVTVLLSLASAIPRKTADERFTGAFATSGVARLFTEAASFVQARGYRERQERAIAALRERLARTPTNLARLQGADVLLFIVESYGEGVMTERSLAARMLPQWRAFEGELGASGWAIASSVLESPTFGGSSWLAHAAMNTGIRTENQLEYQLLVLKRPPTLAQFFRGAGYVTVLVQPATVRAMIEGDYLDFDRKYFARNFEGYRGPMMGWGRLPDQYTIDFVHRRELGQKIAGHPRFIEYALVTSHAPWTREASVIDDWSTMGNGSILNQYP
ncbi:MAG TPA: hypothetical protein VGQ57_03925, partial [Polyangiaceae bacterium]|nr:hypothetical protein [Polyangiaceae bacterium]